MSSRIAALLVPLFILSLSGGLAGRGAADPRHTEQFTGKPVAWTVSDLYASPSPYALGHRGYGADEFDPSEPLENTLEAFHLAFQDGIRVVELDLQRTADGKIVVFHDDYLEDFTCVNSLTYDELLARHPEVPLFGAVLNSARHFGFQNQLSGILFAEIKAPVPLCDASNTSELAEVSESALVAAVVEQVRRARMEDQVILNSESPSILGQVALQAPEIQRALSLNALQLLSPEQACALLPPELCPVQIPRNECGLEWYNIGPIARLPRYLSFQQFVGTVLGCAASSAVSIDRQVLLADLAQGAGIVAALHGAGIEVIVWTVDSPAECELLKGMSVDGITTNDIALGLACQAPLATPVAWAAPSGSRTAVPVASQDVAGPQLALFPPRANPSQDGAVRIEFGLPDGRPATLELVDIAGRRVETSEVGSLGPGRHTFTFGRNLRPGMYLVRLRHPQGDFRVKAAVLR